MSPSSSSRPVSSRPARRLSAAGPVRRARSSRRSRAWRWCATARPNPSRSVPKRRSSMRIDPAPPSRSAARVRRLRPAVPRGAARRLSARRPRGVSDSLGGHAQSAARHSWRPRWIPQGALGAIGVLSISNPRAGSSRLGSLDALARLQPAMSLSDPALDDTAGQQVSIAFKSASGERLFAGSGTPSPRSAGFAEGKALPRFALPIAVRAKVKVEIGRITSDNVAGTLAAATRRCATNTSWCQRTSITSASAAPINGDAIYNGAMDNASGIATLIEAAAAWSQPAPKALGAVRGRDRRREGPARLALLRAASPRCRPEDRRQPQHGHVPAALPDEEPDGARPRRVRPGRRRSRTSRRDGPRRPGRSRAGAQPLHPQRSVQLHPSGRAGAGAEGRLRARLAAETVDAAWTKERYHAPSDDLAQPIDRSAAVRFTDVSAGCPCSRRISRQAVVEGHELLQALRPAAMSRGLLRPERADRVDGLARRWAGRRRRSGEEHQRTSA